MEIIHSCRLVTLFASRIPGMRLYCKGILFFLSYPQRPVERGCPLLKVHKQNFVCLSISFKSAHTGHQCSVGMGGGWVWGVGLHSFHQGCVCQAGHSQLSSQLKTFFSLPLSLSPSLFLTLSFLLLLCCTSHVLSWQRWGKKR